MPPGIIQAGTDWLQFMLELLSGQSEQLQVTEFDVVLLAVGLFKGMSRAEGFARCPITLRRKTDILISMNDNLRKDDVQREPSSGRLVIGYV